MDKIVLTANKYLAEYPKITYEQAYARNFADIHEDIEEGALIAASQAPCPKYTTYSLMRRGIKINNRRVVLRTIRVGSSILFYRDELLYLLQNTLPKGRHRCEGGNHDSF